MKILVVTFCILHSVFCILHAQTKVRVQDTLYLADGAKAAGSLNISWPAFVTFDGYTVARSSVNVKIVSGNVVVDLFPTTGATPAGTSYTVIYNLNNTPNYTEYWMVPLTGPVTIGQVRVSPVSTPTTTFGEQQLTLGAGLQTLLGFWKRDSSPVSTGEGQCYWDGLAHAIMCSDATLSFQPLAGGGGSTPDATGSIKGKLKLTGDLGGTADSPSVPGLASTVQVTGTQSIAGNKSFLNHGGFGANTQPLNDPGFPVVFNVTETMSPAVQTYAVGIATYNTYSPLVDQNEGTYLIGADLEAFSSGTKNIAEMDAIVALASTQGTGTVARLRGVDSQVMNRATALVQNGAAFHANSPLNDGGGTIANSYGLLIENQIAGVNNWAIKTGLGKVELGDAVSAPSINGIRYADQFPGANAGAKIAAAIANLPATGGTVDARGLEGAQTAAGFAVPAKVTLLLGATTLTTSAVISLADDSQVVGLGWQTMILASGFPAGDHSVVANADVTNGNSRIVLRDVKVDANKAGNSAPATLSAVRFIKCAECIVERVWATNAKGGNGCGLRFEYGSNNTMSRVLAEHSDNIGLSIAVETGWLISDSTARFNAGNGIDSGIGSSSGKLVGSESVSNGGAGFNPDSSGDLEIIGNNFSLNQNGLAITNPQKRMAVTGNRMDSNTQIGLLISNALSQITATGNTITRNGQHGALLDTAAMLTLNGNVVFDNSTSADNGYDGVRITNGGGNSLWHIVSSNVIGNSGATGQRYGIAEVDSGLGGLIGYNTYSSNGFWGNRTGGILLPANTASQTFGNRIDFSAVISMGPGPLQIANLAGAGSRYVKTDANGQLSAGNIAESDVTNLSADLAGKYALATSNTATNVAAPGTPAAGKTAVWTDSSDKTLKAKDDAGVVTTTVKPDAGASNQFLTAVSAAGVPSKAQPAFSNLSGSIASGQQNNPAVGAKGGVESKACAAGERVSAIGTDGVPVCTAVSFSDYVWYWQCLLAGGCHHLLLRLCWVGSVHHCQSYQMRPAHQWDHHGYFRDALEQRVGFRPNLHDLLPVRRHNGHGHFQFGSKQRTNRRPERHRAFYCGDCWPFFRDQVDHSNLESDEPHWCQVCCRHSNEMITVIRLATFVVVLAAAGLVAQVPGRAASGAGREAWTRAASKASQTATGFTVPPAVRSEAQSSIRAPALAPMQLRA